jgi:hypothetical protein
MVVACRGRMGKSWSERNDLIASEEVEDSEVPEANRICTSTTSSSSTAVESQRNLRGLSVVYQGPSSYPLEVFGVLEPQVPLYPACISSSCLDMNLRRIYKRTVL